MSSTSAYVEFAKRAFEREATYREQVFTKVGSVLLRVFLLAMLWTALYRANGEQAGMPLHAMITYATLALVLDLIYGVDGPYIIREKIRNGSVATDFMRPISVPMYLFADSLGQAAFGALQIVPALLAAVLILIGNHVALDPPASAFAAAAVLVSIALGFIVNFFIDLFMSVITFWTMETFGIQLMQQFIATLLSGGLVPLAFFPDAVRGVALALPFAAVYNAPLTIYIGNVRGADIGWTLLSQAGWAMVLAAISLSVWRLGERKLVVQGG